MSNDDIIKLLKRMLDCGWVFNEDDIKRDTIACLRSLLIEGEDGETYKYILGLWYSSEDSDYEHPLIAIMDPQLYAGDLDIIRHDDLYDYTHEDVVSNINTVIGALSHE